jgi:hypothetical protein
MHITVEMHVIFIRLIKALAVCMAAAAQAMPSWAADDFSPSEQALFMAPHLANLHPPAKLAYSYTRSGSLEAAFQDTVTVNLAKRPDGSCCKASAEFLSAERRLALPEVEAAVANPVILYFLERDIREMSRLTKGQAAYFRKRIRMAIFKGAQLSDVSVSFKGQALAAQRISIKPYLDDPLRGRFEHLADKEYIFTLSQQVPGRVYSIRSVIRPSQAASAADVTPLVLEELLAKGATPVALFKP